MVDWGGQANVSGKTCFLAPSFLPLIEEKKQKKIKASGTPAIFGRVPRCFRNVTGQTSPAAAATLPLMEEKKAKEDQGLYRGRGSWPGTG